MGILTSSSTILVILVLCVCSTYEQDPCYDRNNSENCESWKKHNNFCSRSDAYMYCNKTCGFCQGPPTIPPTTTTTTTRAPIPTLIPGSCGVSQVAQSKVVNGVDAKEGAWPWIASLVRSGSHICGATLIHPEWVLTASHCVYGYHYPSQYYVYQVVLGAHHLPTDEFSQQVFKIKQIIVHPEFNSYNLKADVTLLKLDRPAILNQRVVLACMPNKGIYPPLGKQCYIAGWGSVYHPGWPHPTLQQAVLPVVETSKCYYNNEVVCVGKGYTPRPDGTQHPNACRGDSGGPLVCQRDDGRWYLEGVASFVRVYCKYFTGYAPVNKYIDWVKHYVPL